MPQGCAHGRQKWRLCSARQQACWTWWKHDKRRCLATDGSANPQGLSPDSNPDLVACRRGARVAPEKAIVFSQWTGMLDLVEAALGRSRLRCRRLDGSMSISAREAAISSFQARDVGWW